MDTLSRCNEKMVTLLKCVNEWKEREKENCGSFLYSDLRNLSGFIGVVLHDTYRFFPGTAAGLFEGDGSQRIAKRRELGT